MNTLIGAAFIFSATAASASDSVELSNAELDGVTAGITLSAETLSLAFANVEAEGGFTGVFTETESGTNFDVVAGEAEGFTNGISESVSDSEGAAFAAGTASSGGAFGAAGIADIDASSVGKTETATNVTHDSASAFAASTNTTLMFIEGGAGGVSSSSGRAVFMTDAP